ncbi:MAG: hypothetical protein ACLP5H_16020 [Desulfomonilaceae bacterium]
MELAEFLKIQAVWEKGTPIPGEDPAQWRKDAYGDPIYRHDHGNRQSNYGWEKAHIVPDVCGGQKELSNLRPLNWRNNLLEGSGGPLPWIPSPGRPASLDLDALLRVLRNGAPGTSKWIDSPPSSSPGWASYLSDGR